MTQTMPLIDLKHATRQRKIRLDPRQLALSQQRQNFTNLKSFYLNRLDNYIGGRGGIRTHGELAPSPVFKTGSLNRSDTLPAQIHL